MPRRFIFAGTLVGGVLLSLLNWLTAALLPPRFKPFRDPGAVVETIRSNVSGNDIPHPRDSSSQSLYSLIRPVALRTSSRV